MRLSFGVPRMDINRVVDGLSAARNHLRALRASTFLSALNAFLFRGAASHAM
jgi:hypothetical protein